VCQHLPEKNDSGPLSGHRSWPDVVLVPDEVIVVADVEVPEDTVEVLAAMDAPISRTRARSTLNARSRNLGNASATSDSQRPPPSVQSM